MNTNFKLTEIANEASRLLADAKHIFSQSSNNEIRSKAAEIPIALTSGEDKLNIVFAGAYSAGKSTLLSLLTGLPLKTGAGIVTDTCKTLDWKGINVTDTPGIHTELHPDHDATTYDALAHADLVVFVMSQKGFNPHLAHHFRKLAIERHKGPEMMLVINKMDEPGLTPEKCDIIFEGNFADPLAPFTRESLYTSFMSTRRWLQANETSDARKKEQYLARSGRDEFINNLNRFVKDKGLTSKLTTNLFILEHLLTEILASYKTDDNCADGMREMLTRQRNILVDSRNNVIDQSRLIIARQKNTVQGWGNEIASSITSSSKQQQIDSLIKKRMQQVDEVYSNAVEQLQQVVAEEDKKVGEKFQKLATSQFGCQVYDMVKTRITKLKISPELMRNIGNNAKKLGEFGKCIADMAKGPNAMGGWNNFFKITQASQSQMHKVVLNVGHFFGHKFQPWGAVRIAARIGQGAKILGAAGAILGIVAQIWCDKNEDKVEQALLDARNDIRGGFDQAANVIEMEFDEKTQQWVEAKYGAAIKDIDEQLDAIESNTLNHNKEYMALKDLQARCRSLIERIQS